MEHDATLQYYAENAERFFQETAGADMSPVYERFERYLAPGARILDLGCGSGRDSLAFSKKGYCVTAVDGSPAMCRLAAGVTGLPVHCRRFEELEERGSYDAVWACASLLHVRRARMGEILARVAGSLRPGGVLYTSYKYGDGEREESGRYFCDLTESGLSKLLSENGEFVLLESWLSGDVREGRGGQRWLNVIARRHAD